jgi:hypothetical protein
VVHFEIAHDLYKISGEHLRVRAEQAGFFLAEWRPNDQVFSLREWRPVPPAGLACQSDFHLSLTDETCARVIKWSWDAGLSLVEAHSHRTLGPARFSLSDLWGFEDWVPHLWWRLRGRPYAALVTAADTFDAIAWVNGPKLVEQVDALEVHGGEEFLATGETLRGHGKLQPNECDEVDEEIEDDS